MRKVFITVAFGATLISMPAWAQAPGGGERGGWMQRDQTRDEAKQMSDRMFQQLDANRDGTLTRAEAEQAALQFAAARGGDSSGGGRMGRVIDRLFGSAQSLTLPEVEAQSLARFDAMDLNHDGTVSAAERQQSRQQRMSQQSPGQ
jgi:uncharacterized protein YjiS (DUF1127 family)